MFRALMTLFALVSTGCTTLGGVRGEHHLERFEAFVDTQQLVAPQIQIVRAAQTVLAEHGWTPMRPRTFAGRIVVEGAPANVAALNAQLASRQTYAPPSGCRVDIFPQPRGHQLRVTCHGQQPSPVATTAQLPQRVEWQDRYMAAQIIEHVNPAQGQQIWSFEPTGQRSHRCATYAARGAGVPQDCYSHAPANAWRVTPTQARRPIVRSVYVQR